MSDRTLLDIDDTILKKNLLLSKNKHEFEIDEILKQGFEAEPESIIIYPLPGACIKTKTDSGEKVFLNICTTDKIPPPEDLSEKELISLLDQETPPYSIPMSIGKERLEPDKGGTLCMTHDIVLNKNYFEKCQTQNYLWSFTISVIIGGVSLKCAKSLCLDTRIILKNRKVMGTIQPQRIDVRKTGQKLPQSKEPLIQEVSNTLNTDRSVTLAQLQNNCQKAMTNNYVILKEPLEGIAKRLIGLFHIPKGVPSRDLNVLIDADHIIVTTTNENKFAYDMCMPYSINLEKTETFFDKDLSILRLNMPIESI